MVINCVECACATAPNLISDASEFARSVGCFRRVSRGTIKALFMISIGVCPFHLCLLLFAVCGFQVMQLGECTGLAEYPEHQIRKVLSC